MGCRSHAYQSCHSLYLHHWISFGHKTTCPVLPMVFLCAWDLVHRLRWQRNGCREQASLRPLIWWRFLLLLGSLLSVLMMMLLLYRCKSTCLGWLMAWFFSWLEVHHLQWNRCALFFQSVEFPQMERGTLASLHCPNHCWI